MNGRVLRMHERGLRQSESYYTHVHGLVSNSNRLLQRLGVLITDMMIFSDVYTSAYWP